MNLMEPGPPLEAGDLELPPLPDDPLERLHVLADGLHRMAEELHFLLSGGATGLDDRVFDLLTTLHDRAFDMTSGEYCAALFGDDSMPELERVVEDIRETADDINTRSLAIQDVADQFQFAVAPEGSGRPHPGQDPASAVADICRVLTSLAAEMIPIVMSIGVSKKDAVHVHHQILEVVEDMMSFTESISPEGIRGGSTPSQNLNLA